ncbi:hypothetical protein ACOMHN_030259 [Nucella lapillus]
MDPHHATSTGRLHGADPHIHGTGPQVQQMDPQVQLTDPHVQQTDPQVQRTGAHVQGTNPHQRSRAVTTTVVPLHPDLQGVGEEMSQESLQDLLHCTLPHALHAAWINTVIEAVDRLTALLPDDEQDDHAYQVRSDDNVTDDQVRSDNNVTDDQFRSNDHVPPSGAAAKPTDCGQQTESDSPVSLNKRPRQQHADVASNEGKPDYRRNPQESVEPDSDATSNTDYQEEKLIRSKETADKEELKVLPTNNLPLKKEEAAEDSSHPKEPTHTKSQSGEPTHSPNGEENQGMNHLPPEEDFQKAFPWMDVVRKMTEEERGLQGISMDPLSRVAGQGTAVPCVVSKPCLVPWRMRVLRRLLRVSRARGMTEGGGVEGREMGRVFEGLDKLTAPLGMRRQLREMEEEFAPLTL